MFLYELRRVYEGFSLSHYNQKNKLCFAPRNFVYETTFPEGKFKIMCTNTMCILDGKIVLKGNIHVCLVCVLGAGAAGGI